MIDDIVKKIEIIVINSYHFYDQTKKWDTFCQLHLKLRVLVTMTNTVCLFEYGELITESSGEKKWLSTWRRQNTIIYQFCTQYLNEINATVVIG